MKDNILKMHNSLSKERQEEMIKILSDNFPLVTENSIKINWFYNENIPRYAQYEAVKLYQNFIKNAK